LQKHSLQTVETTATRYVTGQRFKNDAKAFPTYPTGTCSAATGSGATLAWTSATADGSLFSTGSAATVTHRSSLNRKLAHAHCCAHDSLASFKSRLDSPV